MNRFITSYCFVKMTLSGIFTSLSISLGSHTQFSVKIYNNLWYVITKCALMFLNNIKRLFHYLFLVMMKYNAKMT